ncbi:NAD(P)-dependent oxidoreductase [Actinomadura rudentiformis]|uniref:3-phosphoglycerate dehydrogenase n=1 Tax=Actinomadura rudentiformis TaxID=359158 RepID=A0A6H9Z8M2_9ACTN|nr:NAD(P)-dependent oxidoreductase [Actinomadura rudentiformis]KAB2352676.1 3-phosphoglycerate dehydrogenase [Actinomadura rudentiformis]
MAERKGRALVLAPMRGPGWELLNELADVVYEPAYEPAAEQRPFRLRPAADVARGLAETGATILVAEADEVAGPVFDHPLELVAVTRSDPGNVDVAAATARGIPVLCTPGKGADAVAELTVALLFAVARGVVAADRSVREGSVYAGGVTPYQRHRAWQLAGRTFGIVGLGAVGRAVWWRMDGLGMRVVACDPYAEGATHKLPELLNVADVVSMHAALTEETHGMIGDRQFEIMKDGAVFLNTARAELHDTGALASALSSGSLAGAGLDSGEPSHPLAGLPNVVLTPHIGGATFDAEADQAQLVAADIERLRRGELPQHCVNPEVFPAVPGAGPGRSS